MKSMLYSNEGEQVVTRKGYCPKCEGRVIRVKTLKSKSDEDVRAEILNWNPRFVHQRCRRRRKH